MEAAGFIIGLIALAVGIMALPTIFQMLWGRPHLTFEADDFTGPDGRILVLAIKNEPVKNRFLRLMGVEREAGDLLVFFAVQELGSQKILVRDMSGLLQCAPMRTIGLMARTFPGFTVGATIISTRNGAAQIVNGRSDDGIGIPIAQGHYLARIAVVRGQVTYRIDQTFRVGAQDYQTIWDTRDVVNTRE